MDTCVLGHDTLIEKLLDHGSELLIVIEKLVELGLVERAAHSLSSWLVGAKVLHLLGHLLLHFSEASGLEHVKFGLELLILLLKLVEIGLFVGISLQHVDHILVHGLKLGV